MTRLNIIYKRNFDNGVSKIPRLIHGKPITIWDEKQDNADISRLCGDNGAILTYGVME